MTQSSFFCFEIFLTLRTTLCHYHKFSFFFFSFRTGKLNGDRALHAMGGDLGVEWNSAVAEEWQEVDGVPVPLVVDDAVV